MTEQGGPMARLVPFAGLALCFAAGIALILGALALPESRTADVGPGRLPLLIGIAIVVLAAVSALRQLVDQIVPEGLEGAGQAGILLALLLVYCVLMPLVGVIVSTIVFMMAVMIWLDGPKRWLRSALVTAGFCGCTYALFVWVIATPLP